MSSTAPQTAARPATYTGTTSRTELTIAALRSILEGRPLPEAVRPLPVGAPRPETLQAGIEAILAGRRID